MATAADSHTQDIMTAYDQVTQNKLNWCAQLEPLMHCLITII